MHTHVLEKSIHLPNSSHLFSGWHNVTSFQMKQKENVYFCSLLVLLICSMKVHRYPGLISQLGKTGGKPREGQQGSYSLYSPLKHVEQLSCFLIWTPDIVRSYPFTQVAHNRRLAQSDLLSPTRNTLFGFCKGTTPGWSLQHEEEDSFVMRTVFALISILRVFGYTRNINKRAESNI